MDFEDNYISNKKSEHKLIEKIYFSAPKNGQELIHSGINLSDVDNIVFSFSNCPNATYTVIVTDIEGNEVPYNCGIGGNATNIALQIKMQKNDEYHVYVENLHDDTQSDTNTASYLNVYVKPKS